MSVTLRAPNFLTIRGLSLLIVLVESPSHSAQPLTLRPLADRVRISVSCGVKADMPSILAGVMACWISPIRDTRLSGSQSANHRETLIELDIDRPVVVGLMFNAVQA